MRLVHVAIGLALVVIAPVGHAADDLSEAERAEVRKLGYEGVQDFQAGRYVLAAEKLQRAYESLKVPSLGLWSARALVERGRLVDASARYREIAELSIPSTRPKVHQEAKRTAAIERVALLERIPTVVITLQSTEEPDEGVPDDEDVDGGIGVEIDGALLAAEQLVEAVALDPGEHVVVARRGAATVERRVTLLEGDRITIDLPIPPREVPEPPVEPVPAPTPPPVPIEPAASPPAEVAADGAAAVANVPDEVGISVQETLGWTAVGLGSASVITGAVIGFVALGKYGALDCPNDTCPPERRDEADAINGLRMPSTALLIAGGVLGATGAVLVLTSSDVDASAGLGGASLRVRF